mgnify:CR=1 FL=1
MNVGFISLGCSKNLIDTETTIGIFKENNYKIVNNEKDADIIVINTCGFIDSAKEEAINTILEMAEYKKKRCKYLIVMGCLVQRYYDELVRLLPEVDLFIKIDEYDDLWEKINNLVKKDIVEETKTKTSHKITQIPKMPMFLQEQFMNRTITTGSNFAYLKIGEGCSNKCTYCAIPYIRGPFVSRKEEDIIEEAKQLAEKGITELIIIAQDTTKYGVDIYGENRLADLIEKLSKIRKIKWIRFLYSYPEGITDELIEVVANNKKVAKYFDIPIQHISNSILKRMNRKTNKENIKKLIEKIRNKIPNVTLRTSLIVGFPGETKEDFEELLEFVEKTKFDKLGVFMYSKEDGTPAAKMPDQVPEDVVKDRFDRLLSLVNSISKEKTKALEGSVQEVLVEEVNKKIPGYVSGRLSNNSVVHFPADVSLIGSLVNVKLEEAKGFYYMGEMVD